MRIKPLRHSTRQKIASIFQSLDYGKLATIYCDEGGKEFWADRAGPCQRLGIKLATVLRHRLQAGGRSLYVGAGVAEIPMLVMETEELGREVVAYNLRSEEVKVLNQACYSVQLKFHNAQAQSALGRFDHIWVVSVLNDPERFPALSALSYGRANPVSFNPRLFMKERATVWSLIRSCLQKLSLPGLVTTSVEEIPWITHWCEQKNIPYVVEERDYPTAIVGDPVCFIRVG